VVRAAVRARVARRLRREGRGDVEAQSERFRALVARLRAGQVAVAQDAANAQHYEVPPELFTRVLGPHLKYSCCWFPPGVEDLATAERLMLERTAERARLADGQDVLDLGCGWGSLSLWLAERHPASRILAVSNSAPQREFILARARERGIANLEVVTADVADFDPGRRFDRVVSVEMLEHVKNTHEVLGRVARWLRPDGYCFIHVFTHRTLAFEFQSGTRSDWIGRNFFTGGTMPSDDLLLHMADDLVVADHWRLDGTHYERTALAWAANLEREREAVLPVLERTYGPGQGERWLQRWRFFFLACAGLWGFRGGREFIVSHYLFRPRAGLGPATPTHGERGVT
jgi:cyclopropane-fatty-acyl-phospholipid synthase